jgi:hypothetical protein
MPGYQRNLWLSDQSEKLVRKIIKVKNTTDADGFPIASEGEKVLNSLVSMPLTNLKTGPITTTPKQQKETVTRLFQGSSNFIPMWLI